MKTTRSAKCEKGKPFCWIRRRSFPSPTSLASCGSAYRNAAVSVYSALAQNPGSDESTDAYPLVFLYRHSTETYIKAILLEFGPARGKGQATATGKEIKNFQKAVRDRGHNLCKQVPDLLLVSQLVNRQLSDRARSSIHQIDGVDPKSTSFRYDEWNEEDIRPGGGNHQGFNVQHFVQEMEFVIGELNSLHDELAQHQSLELDHELRTIHSIDNSN